MFSWPPMSVIADDSGTCWVGCLSTAVFFQSFSAGREVSYVGFHELFDRVGCHSPLMDLVLEISAVITVSPEHSD